MSKIGNYVIELMEKGEDEPLEEFPCEEGRRWTDKRQKEDRKFQIEEESDASQNPQ